MSKVTKMRSRARSSSTAGVMLAASAAAIGVAFAASAADELAGGRYSMTPAEGGGFVRLDRQTGAMSLCTGKEGEWSCKPMSETDAATRRRIEDLEKENRELKAQSPAASPDAQAAAPRGDTIPPDAPPGTTEPPPPPGDLKMPTERDVDQLFDYVEGMVKKFKERIERLEKEAKKEPATPL